jgi:Lipocalin-like domain
MRIPNRTLSTNIHKYLSAMSLSDLAGGWSLVDYRLIVNDNEKVIFPLGTDAQGYILYTPGGVMSANLAKPGAKPHGAQSPHDGTIEEKARSLGHTLSYAGTYTVEKRPEPNKFIIRHQVTISSFPNWVGTAQTRLATLTGDRLVLETDKPVVFTLASDTGKK